MLEETFHRVCSYLSRPVGGAAGVFHHASDTQLAGDHRKGTFYSCLFQIKPFLNSFKVQQFEEEEKETLLVTYTSQCPVRLLLCI